MRGKRHNAKGESVRFSKHRACSLPEQHKPYITHLDEEIFQDHDVKHNLHTSGVGSTLALQVCSTVCLLG